MNWEPIVNKVSPYVVHIYTQSGSGTGFLCLQNDNKSIYGIATAFHVVSQAKNWQQPIRIVHHASGKAIFLKEPDRIIDSVTKFDSAVILIGNDGTIPLPEELVKLRPIDKPLLIGSEVGWLGFPSVAPDNLCFFSGNVSARNKSKKGYFIDGVAINGVSGGPVVISDGAEIQFVGVITSYSPNWSTGEPLPGLAYAQDVSHFHDTYARIKSLDEAAKQKKPEKVELPHTEQQQQHTSE